MLTFYDTFDLHVLDSFSVHLHDGLHALLVLLLKIRLCWMHPLFALQDYLFVVGVQTVEGGHI